MPPFERSILLSLWPSLIWEPNSGLGLVVFNIWGCTNHSLCFRSVVKGKLRPMACMLVSFTAVLWMSCDASTKSDTRLGGSTILSVYSFSLQHFWKASFFYGKNCTTQGGAPVFLTTKSLSESAKACSKIYLIRAILSKFRWLWHVRHDFHDQPLYHTIAI